MHCKAYCDVSDAAQQATEPAPCAVLALEGEISRKPLTSQNHQHCKDPTLQNSDISSAAQPGALGDATSSCLNGMRCPAPPARPSTLRSEWLLLAWVCERLGDWPAPTLTRLLPCFRGHPCSSSGCSREGGHLRRVPRRPAALPRCARARRSAHGARRHLCQGCSAAAAPA